VSGIELKLGQFDAKLLLTIVKEHASDLQCLADRQRALGGKPATAQSYEDDSECLVRVAVLIKRELRTLEDRQRSKRPDR
jgi:hypothetical protein